MDVSNPAGSAIGPMAALSRKDTGRPAAIVGYPLAARLAL